MSDERRLAEAYYKLLARIDWDDELLVAGLREGLNKFLANAFLSLHKGKGKYKKSHYVSAAARDQMSRGIAGGLVFEHIVPKQGHIQNQCRQRAEAKELTAEFIEGLLKQFWLTATITAVEDARCSRLKMPDDWDGQDAFARYRAAGIELFKASEEPSELPA